MQSLETRIARLERIVADPSVRIVVAPDTASLRLALRDARSRDPNGYIMGVVTGVPLVTERVE